MQATPVNLKKSSKIFVVGEPQDANNLRFQLIKQGYRNVYTFRQLIDASEALTLMPADLVVADSQLPEFRIDYLDKLSKKHPLVTGVTVVAVVCEQNSEIGRTIFAKTASEITVEAVYRQRLAESVDQLLEARIQRLNNLFSTGSSVPRAEFVEKEQSLRAAFQRRC